MKQKQKRQIELSVENIGGINQTELTFDEGVTVLSGRNATNRTSLLQAIMAGLGSNRVSLKGDAEEGAVTLQLGDERYTRTLRRQGETVVFDGDPYLDDPQLADLFAFLLEENEVRRTVARGGNLREVMMKPVDTAEIQAEIERVEKNRDRITNTIEELDGLEQKRRQLQSKRDETEYAIEETTETLAAKREAVDDSDPAQARNEQSALEQKLTEIQRLRQKYDDATFQLKSHQESLESLKTEREELVSELDGYKETEPLDADELDGQISKLRNQKQELERGLSRLQQVIQFNEEMLDGTHPEIQQALRDEVGEALTDQLVSDESVICWTCGTEVSPVDIEETIERLQRLRRSKYADKKEVESELSELKTKQQRLEAKQTKREQTEQRLHNVRAEISEHEHRVEELSEQRLELESEIESLETEIDELETRDRSETLSAHRKIGELEAKLDRLRTERNRLDEQLSDIESQREQREELNAQKQRLQTELEELKTRVDRLERDAIDAFNDHMQSVLDILRYENIERIWVERAEETTRQGRRNVTQSTFRLHVVRTTDDGVSYEDSFEHLSESEREVTGLVFALAGYLTHEVHEDVPVILLDSLEAIDAQRIDALVEYLTNYADFLIVTLLSEDADAIETDHHRITKV